MPTQTPPFPQNPAHGNGTCEQCGGPCAVYGCRYCPECYYVNGVPRDLLRSEASVPEKLCTQPE